MQKICLLILLCVMATGMTACGIKPKKLDAPHASQDADTYPRIYPSSPASSK